VSDDFTEIVVYEAKGAGSVVKSVRANEVKLQLQSENAPNPQNFKFLVGSDCSTKISFPIF
jgi:hypothetical protein